MHPNPSPSHHTMASFRAENQGEQQNFMYGLASCDRDPWLQPSTCDRFGGYVPPDVREALYQIDHERFPLTWKSISPSLKQQLVKDYQQGEQPVRPSRELRTDDPTETVDKASHNLKPAASAGHDPPTTQSQPMITKPQQLRP